jgi:hypothetical protein
MNMSGWLANFSGYWKEVSVILTGLFAVLGLAGEYKDKATGKLTRWGRTFLVMTIIAMAFGLIAQIEDNKDSKKLQERTQKSVHQLSRIIQAFDQPTFEITLKMNCTSGQFKDYCQAHRKKAPSTTDLPGGPQVKYTFKVYFVKDKRNFDAYLASGRADGLANTDTSITLTLSNYVSPEMKEPNLQIWRSPDGGFELGATQFKAPMELSTQRIISIADLSGATMIIKSYGTLLNDLTILDLKLTTPRGQQVFASVTPHTMGDERVFTYTFPADPAADDD